MRILLVAASLAFVLALTGIGNGQEQQSSSGKHGRSLEIDPAFVAGNWRVAKVRTEPDMDVAALADDDPPYMGANLAFSAEAGRPAGPTAREPMTIAVCRAMRRTRRRRARMWSYAAPTIGARRRRWRRR